MFVKLHLNPLVACDLFCKNVKTLRGKWQAYALIFMHDQKPTSLGVAGDVSPEWRMVFIAVEERADVVRGAVA